MFFLAKPQRRCHARQQLRLLNTIKRAQQGTTFSTETHKMRHSIVLLSYLGNPHLFIGYFSEVNKRVELSVI